MSSPLSVTVLAYLGQPGVGDRPLVGIGLAVVRNRRHSSRHHSGLATALGVGEPNHGPAIHVGLPFVARPNGPCAIGSHLVLPKACAELTKSSLWSSLRPYQRTRSESVNQLLDESEPLLQTKKPSHETSHVA